MALDGPIDSKIITYLKNALEHELDDMLSQYMNALFLQQRIVYVTHQFEKNANLSAEIKEVLQNLINASAQYLEDFNKKSLLYVLESALKTLNEQQGYVINVTQNAKTCSDISQQLIPIKADLTDSVSIESLFESFVVIEQSSLLASTLPPPPPPPPPPKAPPQPKLTDKPVVKPAAKVEVTMPRAVPAEHDLNREKLFKRLQGIEKAIEQHTSKNPEESEHRKLNLCVKRELTTAALEAQRRRYKQQLADLRSDPSAIQQEGNSRGLVFLSMLRSEITERKDKVLKTKALQKLPALKNDALALEVEFEKLHISTMQCRPGKL